MHKTSKALVILLTAYAFSGVASEKSYRCKAEVQACLNEMVTRLKTRGWLGIEMDEDEKMTMITVVRVVPGGPAQSAGFKVGDALLALNGMPLCGEHRAEQETKVREALVPGATVVYTVKRGKSELKLPVKLAELPPDVMAQMIGQHMLEHHLKVELTKK